jgi:hypothetical protein
MDFLPQVVLRSTALSELCRSVSGAYMSGAPFTVITTANTTNVFPAGTLRPNVLRDPSLSGDQRTVSRWFDTSAFAAPAPFTFGNSLRSGLRGAPLVTTDMTLEKSFELTELMKFDLRGEFYNLLNHANFSIPGRPSARCILES